MDRMEYLFNLRSLHHLYVIYRFDFFVSVLECNNAIKRKETWITKSLFSFLEAPPLGLEPKTP